jgi:hypothetical protein
MRDMWDLFVTLLTVTGMLIIALIALECVGDRVQGAEREIPSPPADATTGQEPD